MYMYVYVHTYTYTYIYIHVYICIHIYMYIYIYIYTYMYIHKYIDVKTYTHEKQPIHIERDPYFWKKLWQIKKNTFLWRHFVCCAAHMKRDLLLWKETHSSDNRLLQIKRNTFLPAHNLQNDATAPHAHEKDVYIWKETYSFKKRPTHLKRDLYKYKGTYFYLSTTYKMTPQLHTHMRKDLLIWKQEEKNCWLNTTYKMTPQFHTHCKDVYIRKETYSSEKRPTHPRRDVYV